MKTFLGLLLLVALFTACAGEALKSTREDLLSSITGYNDLLRRGEFDKAKSFVVESKQAEFDARAKAAQGVKVAEYRLMRTDFETEKGEEIIDVELKYTISPGSEVKTLIDKQKWSFVYVKEEKKKRWRLFSALPEFK